MSLTSVTPASLTAPPELAPGPAAAAQSQAPQPSAGPALGIQPGRLTVVARRHPWRWVGVVVVVVLLAQFLNGLATNPGWDWPTFVQFFTTTTIIEALWITVQLTIYGTLLGFALGVVLAAMRLSQSAFLQVVSWGYVWAFRSIPLIVQLLFWFNIAYLYETLSLGVPFGPAFLSVQTNNILGALGAAVLGLALHQAAYAAEIIRAGLLSVDQGQLEAAAALGIRRGRQFRRIVFPQAMRSILPNAANEVISLFKGTSIVSVMAIPELFYQVQVIYGRNSRVVPLLMVATLWYIVLTTLLSIGQCYLERHFARGTSRTTPPTPLQKVRSSWATAVGAARRGRPQSLSSTREADPA